MGKSVLLTYQGITLNKQEWANFLGISVSSFHNRVKKYYPHEPEKVFSEVYLIPGANMPNENILQARKRVKESFKKQAQYCKLQQQRKLLRQTLATVENDLANLNW